jgi:NAD(P)-dependent dehydrogenase (short-subunit alcohol dehydrogenase family)
MKLDVTKAEDIEAAVARVDAENPQGLYALVNNAGGSRICLAVPAFLYDRRLLTLTSRDDAGMQVWARAAALTGYLWKTSGSTWRCVAYPHSGSSILIE